MRWPAMTPITRLRTFELSLPLELSLFTRLFEASFMNFDTDIFSFFPHHAQTSPRAIDELIMRHAVHVHTYARARVHVL